jgi:hypothetical protein
VDSWWTVVAGVCFGLAAAMVALDYVPSAPNGPGELQVFALGLVIGLMVFVGPPLVRSAVNPVICSEPTMRRLTEVPILVGIPRVSTQDTREAARRRRLLNVFLSGLAIVALAATAMVVWT